MKEKQNFKNFFWWLGVVTTGVFLGFSLQLAQAWTEPTAAPPNGNLEAPINTSSNSQYKSGALGVGGILKGYSDIYGDDDLILNDDIQLGGDIQAGGTVCDKNGCIGDGGGNFQERVSGTCSPGSSIRAIHSDGRVTCETDDTGGSVDTSDFQKRVNGHCSAGSSIRAIRSDGTVICEKDDIGSSGGGGVKEIEGGFGIDVWNGTSSKVGLSANIVDIKNKLKLEYRNCQAVDAWYNDVENGRTHANYCPGNKLVRGLHCTAATCWMECCDLSIGINW